MKTLDVDWNTIDSSSYWVKGKEGVLEWVFPSKTYVGISYIYIYNTLKRDTIVIIILYKSHK